MTDRDETATVQFKLRMRESLRRKLEASSRKSETSITSEIIERLERSFRKVTTVEDAAAGSRKVEKLMEIIAIAAHVAELATGARVDDDEETLNLVIATALEMFATIKAKPSSDTQKVVEFTRRSIFDADKEAVKRDMLAAGIDPFKAPFAWPADGTTIPRTVGP